MIALVCLDSGRSRFGWPTAFFSPSATMGEV